MTDEKYLKILGEKIAELRKKKYTQEEFAAKLSSHRATVIRIELGQVHSSITMLRRISTVLGMPLHKLIKID